MRAGRPALSGIVLAGGAGRRMGRPKGGVVLDGITMARHAVDMLRPHCDQVIVVGRRGIPVPRVDVPVHMDGPGPDAPLTGIATGLGVVTGTDVLVLACDLPFAGPALAALAGAGPGVAAAAFDGRRLQPLCARYPRSRALAACRALLLSGSAAAMELARALDAAAVPVEPAVLFNVNTDQDLITARQRRTAMAP